MLTSKLNDTFCEISSKFELQKVQKMNEYYFISKFETSNELPDYFFNTNDYLGLQNQDVLFNFKLVSEVSKKVLARVHFSIEGENAHNPAKAPFGGLETCISDVEILSVFWKQIEEILRSKGCKRIKIRCWPDAYQNQTSLLFEKEGFEMLFSDYNYHHIVSAPEAIMLFLKPERKRFRKCLKAGFVFEFWKNPDVKLAHELLSQFRKAKNIPLNISQEQLLKSVETFPEKYFFFSVKNENKIIGISVCVEINQDILYHFCLATDPDYFLFSPSVMLYEGIYRFCLDKKYTRFDFGTASIFGKKQTGLSIFKTKLGGIESLKPTYFKTIA